MSKFKLDEEDDAAVMRGLPAALAKHREERAQMLIHLAEVTRRGLELPRDVAIPIRGLLEDLIDEL